MPQVIGQLLRCFGNRLLDNIRRVDAGGQTRVDSHGDHLPQAGPMPTQELPHGRRIAFVGATKQLIVVWRLGSHCRIPYY
jgi:hypothetical protein